MEKKKNIQVAIIVGSDSDLSSIAPAAKVLDGFGLSYSINVASAHRTPSKVKLVVSKAQKEGARVFICAAGMAAALPGVVAAETVLPVIGVPMEGKALAGMDALFSIVQMPPGIPVAAVAIGKAGAQNAGVLAVQILAVADAALKNKLDNYRKNLAKSVSEKDTKLQSMGLDKYIEMQKENTRK
jgi:phosphoribosylaminoimidazole carboxylase PurE protein